MAFGCTETLEMFLDVNARSQITGATNVSWNLTSEMVTR